jgi:hypothetical protein
MESVKWLKGAEFKDLEEGLVIWIGQVNAKNGIPSDEMKFSNFRLFLKSRWVWQILRAKTGMYFTQKNYIAEKFKRRTV